MADRLLKFQPLQADERCTSAACRRATYVYGLLYEHDQLNRATHETIHELVALPDKAAMEHLRVIARRGSLVAADGRDAYLQNLERLALPITFIHGAESEVFRHDGTEKTLELLRDNFGGELYRLAVLADYGHLDCVIGKDAVTDVYPLVLDHLVRAAAAAVHA
jgi:cholesterol oxidase